MSRLKSFFTVIGLYTFLVVILFFHLFYPTPKLYLNPEYGKSDVSHFNIPVRYIYDEALSNGHIALWSNKIGTGFPLFAESQMGAMYFMNLILYGIAPFWIAFNLSYLTAFIIAACGMYLLVRHLTQNELAGCISGLLYLFSGYFWGHTQHVNMLQSASLMPWILYMYILTTRSRDLRSRVMYFLLYSILISQQIFAGHLQTSFITGFLIMFYEFRNLFDLKFRELVARIAYICGGFALAFVLSAIQILPSAELHNLSVRSEAFSLSNTTHFSFHPKSLLTFVHPFALGNIQDGTYSFLSNLGAHGNIFWETNAYMGIAALIIILISIRYLRSKEIQKGWILIFVGLLCMLGRYSPAYFVYSMLPFNLFTTPARFLIMSTIGVCILSGYVSTYIQKKYLVLLIILTVIQGIYSWHGYGVTLKVKDYFNVPQTASFIHNDESVSEHEKRVLSYGTGAWSKEFSRNGWKKDENYKHYFNGLLANTTVLWGLENHDQYVGRIWTKRKALYDQHLYGYLLDDPIAQKRAERMMSMASIDYIQSPVALKSDHLVKAYSTYSNQTTTTYTVYKNPTSQPRFRMTDELKLVTSVEGLLAYMDSNAYATGSALVESNVWKDEEPDISLDYSVTVQKDLDQSLQLTTSSNKSALLIISDLYYPGWKAYIDGNPKPYYPVNLIQRGIIVPEGKHTVEMKYEPEVFARGKLISIVSYAIVLLIVSLSFSSKNLVFLPNRQLS